MVVVVVGLVDAEVEELVDVDVLDIVEVLRKKVGKFSKIAIET